MRYFNFFLQMIQIPRKLENENDKEQRNSQSVTISYSRLATLVFEDPLNAG